MSAEIILPPQIKQKMIEEAARRFIQERRFDASRREEVVQRAKRALEKTDKEELIVAGIVRVMYEDYLSEILMIPIPQ